MPRVIVRAVSEIVKFKCQRCGACCHHNRPLDFEELIPVERLKEFCERSNLIYLTEKDINSIARRTGKEPAKFVDTLYDYDGCFVKVKDNARKVILDLPVMKSKADTTCIFYENGCTIYSVRPIACRLFPFRVEEETASNGDTLLNIGYNPTCPGIGKGEVVDRRALERLVSELFLQRTSDINPQLQRMMASGAISANAKVYRTLPGKREKN